jgi:hypothetical protein
VLTTRLGVYVLIVGRLCYAVGIMRTFLTIVAAVIISVAVTRLIQHYRHKPTSKNFVKCGLDANGHIVPDGKGGCIPPPPSGYIVDVPKH